MTHVYRHIRKDNGKPFYIGIGNSKRPYNTDARNAIWKYIVNEETEYTVDIVASNITREKAYELEKKLIAEYGRIDLGTGTLANRTNGGKREWNEYIGWKSTHIPEKYKKYKRHTKHELTISQVHMIKDKMERDVISIEYGMNKLHNHYVTLYKRIRNEYRLWDSVEKKESQIYDAWYKKEIRRIKKNLDESEKVVRQERWWYKKEIRRIKIILEEYEKSLRYEDNQYWRLLPKQVNNKIVTEKLKTVEKRVPKKTKHKHINT